ncbi:sodium:solute symporter family protein [Saccharopolyspora sp. NPDC002376]
MDNVVATVACAVVVLAGSVGTLVAARRSARGRVPDDLGGWALAGRRHGGVLMWCLLGGTIYTAYTFTAVPGTVFSSGAIGFYAVPYTVISCAIGFVLLPRLVSVARAHGYVTVADFVRGRYGSPLLALAVALTGIFATMPYVALQLIGIRAVLTVLGLYSGGMAGDLVLTVVFAILALSTYRYGLRAPVVAAVLKAVLVVACTVVVAALAVAKLGTPPEILERAGGAQVLTLPPALWPAYVSLALGSALALFAFPHVLMVAFSARGPDVLRRTAGGLLGWAGMLAVFALLGVAALAAGVVLPRGQSELAVPMLMGALAPSWLAGLLFGVLVVAALVPAAVMSMGAATLFARNVYVEFVNPTATDAQEARMARLTSLVVKIGALAFALGLRDQAAINLHLLGAVWVLQTLPMIVLGLLRHTPHPFALLAGWLAGMVAGTVLVNAGGFTPLVIVHFGQFSSHIYTGIVALAVNVVVSAAAQVLLRGLRVPRAPSGVIHPIHPPRVLREGVRRRDSGVS